MKHLPVERTLDSAMLAKELAISVQQIKAWVKAGCPNSARPRPHGGRPQRFFDAFEVKAWLISRGIAPRSAASQEPIPEVQAEELLEPVGLTSGEADEGYEGMHTRLKSAERIAFQQWVFAVRAKSDVVQTAALGRLWLEQVEGLRKVEKDLSGIRGQRDRWISVDEVRILFVRCASEVKQALIAIPRSVAPRAVGLAAGEIELLLTQEIDQALRALSECPVEEAKES